MKNRKFLEVSSLVLSIIILIFGAFIIIASTVAMTSPSLETTDFVSDILQMVLVVSILIFTSVVLFLSFLYFKKAKQFDTESLALEEKRKADNKRRKLESLKNKINKLEN
ncbi:MAG: hypothetical protein PHV79_00185 [Clostridia bacterium]|jgi:divalent metal cation (Fe/Co/Zn/Cd) transporter|nr:hypothetical protein [Clostridia bacterium]